MDEEQRAKFNRLRAEFEELDHLHAQHKDIEKQLAQAEAERNDTAISELAGKRAELLDRIVAYRPNDFIRHVLLSQVKSAHEIRSEVNRSRKPRDKASIKELLILEKSATEASDLLEGEESDLLLLCMLLLEVGKRIGVLSSYTGKNTGFSDYESSMARIQTILHRKGSGKGGAKKAERERAEKLQFIKPVLDELKRARLSGKYGSLYRALDKVLAREEFQHIETELRGKDEEKKNKKPWISYDNFFIPEARKIWKGDDTTRIKK